MRKTRLFLTALVVVSVLAAPAGANAATIVMSGSTTVYPLAVDLAKAYNRRTGTKFRILQGGSDVGVADAARGRVTLGMSSRDPKAGDPGGITFYRIARDAICVVTNRARPVSNFSRRQVQAIYRGFPTRPRYDIYARSAPSGTQDAFQKLFLDPFRQTSAARLLSSNGQVALAVRRNPRGIGYISLAFTSGLNKVRYQGVGCTLRKAKSGTYPGSRNLYFVSRGQAGGAAAGFIRFARSRAGGQIAARNYVPFR